MKKKAIDIDVFNDLLNSTNWGGMGVEYYKKQLSSIYLTNIQIDEIIEYLLGGISSSLENSNARETVAYLEKLKD